MFDKRFLYTTVLLLAITFSNNVFSQSNDKSNDSISNRLTNIVKNGARFNFTQNGSSYLKFGMGVQLWYRNMEMNPNSIDKGSLAPIYSYSDFALRRMRLSAMMNFEGKHFIYTQFGLTSEGSYNGLHSGIFFHDLWYKARIFKNTYLGGGLHMWNGLSRLSNVTYATQITLDNPGINFPNVNVSDDFVRQYGIFLQGRISRVEYSFSVNQPLLSTTSTKILNDEEIMAKGNLDIAYNRYHSNFNYKGYISYNLFEKESVAKTPFKRMTYYGKKGIFLNIGSGFQFVDDASGVFVKNVNCSTPQVESHHQLSLSADVWFELPLPNESVFNVYSAYYHYDYGSNYLKSGSVIGGFATSNPKGTSPAQGSGINQFTIGTGEAAYFSMSYVLPKNILNSDKRLMPFYAVTYKNFEGLSMASFQQDFGIHYLILGNNVKLSAQYSTRPIFDATTLDVSEYKGAFTLQLHAKF